MLYENNIPELNLKQVIEDNQRDNMQYDNLYVLKMLIKSSIPSILSLLFIFLYDNINIIFAGNYLTSDAVSSIGMGQLYINATGFFLAIGLLGGVDTLCSQAYGARQYYMMGTYANVARICMFAFYIIISLPFLIANEDILSMIGQPEIIIKQSPEYIRSMIPAVFFSMQFHVSIHYLQAMKIFIPGMLITLITSIFHSLWCFLFIVIIQLDLKGIAYANGVTQLLNFILISLYIHYYNPCPESYFGFDQNSGNLIRIYEYLKLAIPSGINSMADWLGFHVIVLYSSYIDIASTAANVSIYSFTTFIFTIPLGISFACCTHVGNAIGAYKIDLAQKFSIFAVIIGVSVIFFITAIISLCNDSFPYIYTNDPQVAEMFKKLLGFFVYFCCLDAIQIILNGILKGLGQQKAASLIILIIMYPINVPVAITFAFSLNYKSYGLWYSQMIAITCLIFSYCIMIFSLDWESNSIKTIKHIRKISLRLRNSKTA